MLIHPSKRYIAALSVVACLAYGLVFGLANWPSRTLHPAAPAMREAAEIMVRATRYIALTREKAGWRPGPEDPNATGLIGDESSVITTTQGNLVAKRTATNPDFAALIVRLLFEIGIRPGDAVAASFSGSFPGLNIATLAATQALHVKLIVISSVGASSWGANVPGWTWPELQRLLIESGVLSEVPTVVTLGAGDDLGHGLPPEGLAAAQTAAERSGFPLILKNTRTDQQQARLNFYGQVAGSQPIKAYINVGGNETSLGVYPTSECIVSGLNRPSQLRGTPIAGEGIAHVFLRRGVPVLNLLDVQDLALRYGLPVDPVPLPVPGCSAIYYKSTVPRAVCWAAILVLILLTTLVVWIGYKEGK